jgi:hypothetical protein
MTATSLKTDTKLGVARGPAKLAVGLLGEATSARWKPLFESLGQLFPVEFHHGPVKNGHALDAVIAFSRRYEEGMALAPKGLPVYLALEDAAHQTRSAGLDIRFGASASLDRCLQGQVMEDRDLRTFFPITPVAGD